VQLPGNSEIDAGAGTHNTMTGTANYLADDVIDAVAYVKALLSYLPTHQREARLRQRCRLPAEQDVRRTLCPMPAIWA
jgi:acetyl-CoA carboxylase carboxyltransferase component